MVWLVWYTLNTCKSSVKHIFPSTFLFAQPGAKLIVDIFPVYTIDDDPIVPSLIVKAVDARTEKICRSL